MSASHSAPAVAHKHCQQGQQHNISITHTRTRTYPHTHTHAHAHTQARAHTRICAQARAGRGFCPTNVNDAGKETAQDSNSSHDDPTRHCVPCTRQVALESGRGEMRRGRGGVCVCVCVCMKEEHKENEQHERKEARMKRVPHLTDSFFRFSSSAVSRAQSMVE